MLHTIVFLICKAVRIVLGSISTHASRYRRYIVPVENRLAYCMLSLLYMLTAFNIRCSSQLSSILKCY